MKWCRAHRVASLLFILAIHAFSSSAWAQFQTANTAGALGGGCTTGNFAWPDSNGFALKCVSGAWAATSGGTVNSGSQYQIGYYATGGTAISGDANVTTDASNNFLILGGNLAIGTTTVTNAINIGGQAAQTVNMVRDVTASTAGQNLTIGAGGAVTGGTDLAGGNLVLSSGISTGTRTSNVQFQMYPAAASTGSADNTATTALTISETGTVTGGTGSFGNLAATLQTTAASGTDKNGSTLTLASGVSTGTGTSSMNFKVYGAGSTGSAANTATTAMTITSAGNVGIGTTSPGAKLQINGTASNSNPIYRMTDGTQQMDYYLGTGGWIGGQFGMTSNHPFYIWVFRESSGWF
jgi:hypothetical protein